MNKYSRDLYCSPNNFGILLMKKETKVSIFRIRFKLIPHCLKEISKSENFLKINFGLAEYRKRARERERGRERVNVIFGTNSLERPAEAGYGVFDLLGNIVTILGAKFYNFELYYSNKLFWKFNLKCLYMMRQYL